MTAASRKIRAQLNAAPKRKTFRKSRKILLEIAIELEVMEKVIRDMARDLGEPSGPDTDYVAATQDAVEAMT